MSAEQKKLKVVDSNSRLLHYGTRVLVILIAIGAGILSFDGLAQLAIVAGVREELAYVWALVIDGFILVATFATFALKDRSDGDRIKKYYAWVILAIFVIISIFGNALHALPQDEGYTLPMWVKISVNAVPPIALFLAIHLIIIMVSPTSDEKKDKEAERKRKEREQKMIERKLLAAERLNEREAEKIEKGLAPAPTIALASPEIQTVAPTVPAAETLTPATPTASPKVTPQRDYIPNFSEKPKTLEINAENTTSAVMTKEEAQEILRQMLADGTPLPSGREVGEWMGLKERAGQNLLRKAREEHNQVA